MPLAISCINVDEAPQGSLFVASRTCEFLLLSAIAPRLPATSGTSNLSFHLGKVHYSCDGHLVNMCGTSDALGRNVPFWTFRTPALRSYSVRLETLSLMLFKSILADSTGSVCVSRRKRTV